MEEEKEARIKREDRKERIGTERVERMSNERERKGDSRWKK